MAYFRESAYNCSESDLTRSSLGVLGYHNMGLLKTVA
jgi:hypothetical protein